MAAISLIVKYLNGDSSPEEALHIEQWAAASPGNQALLEETWREWALASGESMHVMPDPAAEFEQWQQQLSRPSIGKPARAGWLKGHLLQVGSAVLLLAAAMWFFILPNIHRQEKRPVQTNEKGGVSMPDSARGPGVMPADAVHPSGSLPADSVRESGTGLTDSVRVFDFRNTTMEAASRELSNAYGVRIIARNPRILNCRFTTRFDHESLTYILDVVTETLNIHYAYSPDKRKVYLSGKGCD